MAINPSQHVERAGCPRNLCLLPRLYMCQEKRLEKSKKEMGIQGWTDAAGWHQPLNYQPISRTQPGDLGFQLSTLRLVPLLIAGDLDTCPSASVSLTAWTKPVFEVGKMLLPGLFSISLTCSGPGVGAVGVSRFGLWSMQSIPMASSSVNTKS